MGNIYAIVGATGNTGHVIVERLLNNGKRVKAIGRNEDKLKILADKGAKPLVGDLQEKDFLRIAFKEVTAVYAMVPPEYHEQDYHFFQQRVTDSILSAVKDNGIKYIVALSSVGAHLTRGAGLVQELHDFEESLKTLKNVNIMILRPGYLMENFFSSIPMLKQMSIIGSPMRGDINIPMVNTKDIAEVAARHLLNLDFKGFGIEYVLGQRDLTFQEAARILGEAIGKNELKYVQFPYEDAKKGLMQAGFSENSAEGLVEMARVFNSGDALRTHRRTPENTTPTSIEEFSKSFAEVYNRSNK